MKRDLVDGSVLIEFSHSLKKCLGTHLFVCLDVKTVDEFKAGIDRRNKGTNKEMLSSLGWKLEQVYFVSFLQMMDDKVQRCF